jgi:hypothetical protein
LQPKKADRMDLLAPILRQLIRIHEAHSNGDQTLEVYFYVVCRARLVGQELPSVPISEEVPPKERLSWLDAMISVDIIVKWDPTHVDRETIENYLKNYIVPSYIDR